MLRKPRYVHTDPRVLERLTAERDYQQQLWIACQCETVARIQACHACPTWDEAIAIYCELGSLGQLSPLAVQYVRAMPLPELARDDSWEELDALVNQ